MATTDNKRIAKNTIFLYLRTLLLILVNLYAARLVWQLLGVANYGIYNVVGGIVLTFAFLNSAMVASSQRYISFEIGRGDPERIKKTFAISVKVHFLLSFAVLIIAESIGLWFVNFKLNIPTGRLCAANWVYQCSVFSFILTIIAVPYNACIVAHEHMKVYSYIGILEGVLKLIIVYAALTIHYDPLITYALLILVVSCILRSCYIWYCHRHFPETKYSPQKDSKLMKDMISFAGWSFLGSMGLSVRDQGVNILLNLFFNVSINAAKGIANQVGNVISSFANNFTMALNPQITKRYSSGDIDGMMTLVVHGCRFSMILISFVVIPLLFCAHEVLRLWLGNVAPYTVGFLQLILIMALIDCGVSPLVTSLQATGKIKKFQIVIAIITISTIPIAWIGLKSNLNPYIVMYSAISMSITALIARIMLLHEQIKFQYIRFFSQVYGRTLPMILLAAFCSWIIYNKMPSGVTGLIAFVLCTTSILILFYLLIGSNANERRLIVSTIKNRVTQLCRKK